MDHSSLEPSRAAGGAGSAQHREKNILESLQLPPRKPLLGQKFTSTNGGLVFAVLLDSAHMGMAMNDVFCHP